MRLLLGLSIAFFAFGCVSMNVQRLDEVSRPQRSPGEVQLLTVEPDRPFTVIATIESKAKDAFSGFDDLRQKLVAEAEKLGGEAIILGEEGTDPTMLITATGQIHSDQKKLTGRVIVYPPPE